ncbi:MAG: DUF5615 family PIN-like protein [bacterium]|nr:DUF5615 family PIN-like protein [bacterium]
MNSLKFYLDTHINKQVAIQLRQRGVGVIRCQEVGMADVADEEHLHYAIEHKLTIVTKDDDFYRLHFLSLQSQKTHWGIFLCRDRQVSAIGKIVTFCDEYYRIIEAGAGTLDDIKNRVFEIV